MTERAPAPPPSEPGPPPPPITDRIKRVVFGGPRDLGDASLFRQLSLVPFLAWVGLGADGLSSSAYGPEEAFRTLGEHRFLAVFLAVLMAATVIIISAAYSRIIEQFPQGGGGYGVATKLLGERVGVVSGSALLVDYVLTITISIAAAGDALFSLLPAGWQPMKLPFEAVTIGALITLNIRGVRESVITLTPVFVLFLVTHAALIGGGLVARVPHLPETATAVRDGLAGGAATLGLGGLVLVFVHAYSLGGGTYTGIEAVSNGVAIMREPRVQTARRTMAYMAASLAVCASGLLLCYLLWDVHPAPNKTLNAVLAERVVGGLPLGGAIVVLTLLSEGLLLVVAAQTGFVGGPRVLANMAVDSWMPRRFAALSERLTTQNGVLVMGGASLAALAYTHGDVRRIVVMYSINVFITFSLSMFAMARSWFRARLSAEHGRRRFALFAAGFVLCATILVITVLEKFLEGGWLTLAVSGSLVVLCFLIRAHYRTVAAKLAQLYSEVGDFPAVPSGAPTALDPTRPTAAVLVGAYGGLGIHTVLNIFRIFPNHYKNLVFVTVGVIDSGGFKGREAVEGLKAQSEATVRRYLDLARALGVPATGRTAIGTDAVAEAERMCLEVARDFPQTTYFAGKVIFEREKWYQPILHNETAFAVQKRLQWTGMTMVIIPAKV